MAERALYPGNSDKEKREIEKSAAEETQTTITTTEEPKKIEKKPLSGAVVKRKKSLADSFAAVFFGEHAKNVVSYILYDVLIPAAKDTITTMVKTGIEMAVYGETRRDGNLRRDRDRTVISYDRYYDRDRDRDRPLRRTTREEPSRLRSRYNFEEIVFTRRADAEYVLGILADAIDQYESVSVAEFFEAAEQESTHVDEKYGWENLRDAAVRRVRDGYILDLPRPIVLD